VATPLTTFFISLRLYFEAQKHRHHHHRHPRLEFLLQCTIRSKLHQRSKSDLIFRSSRSPSNYLNYLNIRTIVAKNAQGIYVCDAFFNLILILISIELQLPVSDKDRAH